MKKFPAEDMRNVALIGHQGCGKTSLGEVVLFLAGVNTRIGSVPEKSSLFDFEPEEKDKGASLSAAIASFEWKKKKVTLIDTPGDANFFSDSQNALTVADIAAITVSAVDGVEVQTELGWGLAAEQDLPRLVVVTKMDKERADFQAIIEDMNNNLSDKITPIVLPLGKEDSFEGVVDLFRMKAVKYPADGSGKARDEDIPADMKDEAAAAREKLVDMVAASDDELTEKYLENGDLSEEELTRGLKKAIVQGLFIPAVCVSSIKNIAVSSLLDLIVSSYPSPAQMPPRKAKNKDGEETEIMPDPAAPFTGQIFKTTVDQFVGKLSFFRVWSGTLSADSGFYNAAKEIKERFGKLFAPVAGKQEEVNEAGPGDIIAVAKLKESQTGDTVCTDKNIVEFPPLPKVNPLISFVLKPVSKGDAAKIGPSLARLIEEDMSLNMSRDTEAEEILLSGLGEDHIRIAVARLQRKFGVNVELLPPKIPYRETVTRKVMNVEGKHKKQTGGHGQFGVCYINIEPFREGNEYKYEFKNSIVGGAIPRNWIPSAEKGVRAAMDRGIVAGFPVVGVRIDLFDGKFHDVDSSDISFQLAGRKAWRDGAPQGNPTILEPIMNVEINCPVDNQGDIMGDISGRRGRVSGTDQRGKRVIINATAPMAEMLRYAPDLKSITGGRGSFIMGFSHYEPLPSHLKDKLIAAAGKRVADDEDD
ncbi:MAG: elongation factor G [Pseudomonadota bacterium]